jgi:dipeptidase E
MRLYLSSHRLGDSTPELLTMVRPGARCAVISNALDFIPDLDRQSYARTVHDPIADFRAYGLEAFDLDLREHFGAPGTLAARLEDVDLVWATGGNAFLLRRAMRQSGFDSLIGGLMAADRLVYGGWSAGAVVAGPHLRGIELMDDPQVLAVGYAPEPCWEGLGLIAQAIVPHYRSDHQEAEAADRAVAWLQAGGLQHIALRDGEVIVARDGELAVRPAAKP